MHIRNNILLLQKACSAMTSVRAMQAPRHHVRGHPVTMNCNEKDFVPLYADAAYDHHS